MLEKYWTGKAVLITGASSGLGAALVDALAKYKVHFGLLSRRVEPMNELAQKHAASGSKFWISKCDVQERSQVEAAVRGFSAEAGRIDVAWVNSGISGETSYGNWDWNKAEETIRTNLNGALYTTVACLQHMIPRRQGTIVAISSSAAMRGLPGRTIYSMTKIAMESYMDSFAAELPYIQFTTIYPGFVDTPINRHNPKRFWLMQPDRAAVLMIKAVAKGKSRYIYPFRMNLLFRAVRSLPTPLYRKLAHRLIELSRPTGEK